MNRASDLAKRPLDADDCSKQWELRPGGMLVQKRDPHADAAHAGPIINLRVSYGRMYHHVSITANSTFGDLKKLLVQDTGLQPLQQRLQFKGKERNDNDTLREVGLKDKSKVVLVEDIVNSEKRLIELRKAEAASKASKAVSEVQQLVDKLSGQVANIEAAVNQGKKLNESEFTGLVDLLMCQLLKLDASKVDGDTNVKKRILTRRIQKYVETMDMLLTRNNSMKGQSGAPRPRNTTPKVHFDANVQKNDVPSDMSKALVSTSWESFGTNYSTKVAPQVSEPLLIQWD
ncbi:hypothetical protein L7F22_060457 [Adiantum nelumboides]|nr:hypothetical protein [Adiantum nelumboides]